MKTNRLMFLAGAASLFAAAAFCSDPLPEESMNAVRTMLRFAQGNPRDVYSLDAVYIEPNFSLPEVFFGMVRIDGDWPVARRKAAFDAYLAVMGDTNFADEANDDRMLPIWATAQCITMNYTNALPYMRRLVMNTTLTGRRRRTEIWKCIAFSPVDNETTDMVETIFTNRVDFTWEDREKCFDYAKKVVAASQSNLVSQSVCDRAARVFTDDATEWQLYREYDIFWKEYYAGYAISSNRLEFANTALANTNITQNSDWAFVKRRFTFVTNKLHSASQPLPWVNMGGGGD